MPLPIDIVTKAAPLKGSLFRPTSAPKAAVVLHGATGVPARYYRHFATWLSQKGYACLTYDYQDFGASATGHPKQAGASMVAWGVQDQAVARLARYYPAAQIAPVCLAPHDYGLKKVGHIAAFHRRNAALWPEIIK